MEPNLTQTTLKAEASAETVEDLVALVRRGEVRLPDFQRDLRWKSDDVVQFFDSIYRGYPVGSFLLNKGKANAGKVRIGRGALTIDAPETSSAYWVIDGQQRLTALTVGLARPMPIPTTPEDEWVVYFDSMKRVFRAPSKDGQLPASWVPVAQLLDASALSEWVHNWTYSGNPALRAAVFEAGTRLRQYRIPLYTVETDDEPLREIFNRINNYGKRLKWEEVHDALYGHSGTHPSTLRDLATELKKLGMGRPEEAQLLPSLLASKGLDATRSLTWHHRRNQVVLKDAVQDALPTLRSVMSFLKKYAEIPHLRLLPRVTPLPVLTRFFTLYPEPKQRTLNLLTRWTWRSLLSAAFFDERTLLRRGVSAIEGTDEEQSVQVLLSLLPSQRPPDYVLSPRFDARAADSRIALVGLASLKPLSVGDGGSIDVADLIEEFNEFRRITRSNNVLTRSPANRILLSGASPARQEIIDRAILDGEDSTFLRSHAISPTAFAALMDRRIDDFIEERKKSIETTVKDLGNRLAAWERTDRPSIEHILKQTLDE